MYIHSPVGFCTLPVMQSEVVLSSSVEGIWTSLWFIRCFTFHIKSFFYSITEEAFQMIDKCIFIFFFIHKNLANFSFSYQNRIWCVDSVLCCYLVPMGFTPVMICSSSLTRGPIKPLSSGPGSSCLVHTRSLRLHSNQLKRTSPGFGSTVLNKASVWTRTTHIILKVKKRYN